MDLHQQLHELLCLWRLASSTLCHCDGATYFTTMSGVMEPGVLALDDGMCTPTVLYDPPAGDDSQRGNVQMMQQICC